MTARAITFECDLTHRKHLGDWVGSYRHVREIADILDLTARTVNFHKYRIMEVLGTKTNSELVRYAVRNHIVAA
jgi:DNA-binding CsgD family transcriptional regulator